MVSNILAALLACLAAVLLARALRLYLCLFPAASPLPFAAPIYVMLGPPCLVLPCSMSSPTISPGRGEGAVPRQKLGTQSVGPAA